MDRNALVVNGLTKRYQDFTLDGVSFTVPQGSIVGLIGENGAGKSTTLHAVLGLIGRDGGTVELRATSKFWASGTRPCAILSAARSAWSLTATAIPRCSPPENWAG